MILKSSHQKIDFLGFFIGVSPSSLERILKSSFLIAVYLWEVLGWELLIRFWFVGRLFSHPYRKTPCQTLLKLWAKIMEFENLLNDALERLEWPRLMDHVAKESSYEETKTHFRNLRPWLEASQRSQWIAWCQALARALEKGYDLPLTGVSVGDLLSRLRIGSLVSLAQLQDLQTLIAQSVQLNTLLRTCGEPDLHQCFGQVPQCQKLLENLSFCLDGQGGLLDRASPDLSALRKKLWKAESAIAKELDTLIQKAPIKDCLQDQVWMQRDGHYVLPVKVASKNEITGTPKGLSSSGSTVFVEPASLSALQAQLDDIRNKVELEEFRIVQELSRLAHGDYENIKIIYSAILKLDILKSRATFHKKIQGVWPHFHTDLQTSPRFHFQEAKHPLYILEGHPCVENTLEMPPGGKVWILSGPNAGGKTVVMRTVGLLTLMALAGFSITAQGGLLYSTPFVFADLGDRQNRMENLSTFSGHLEHIGAILKYAVKGSLILLDECFVGTDPEMGLALARSTLEYLAELDMTAVVTTHFDGLKKMSEIASSFVNGSMEFSTQGLVPTYRLITGIPGKSYAFELAGRLGFPKRLLETAREYYGSENTSVDNLIADLARKNEELGEQMRALKDDHANVEALKTKYTRKLISLDNDKKTYFDSLHVTLEKRLRAFQFLLEKSLQEDDPEAFLSSALDDSTQTHGVAQGLSSGSDTGLAEEQKSQKKRAKESLKDFRSLSKMMPQLPTTDTSAGAAPPKKVSPDVARRLTDMAQEGARALKAKIDNEKKAYLAQASSSPKNGGTELPFSAHNTKQAIKLGDRVGAPGFKTPGEVLALADAKGNVLCLFNGLKVKIPLTSLVTQRQIGNAAPQSVVKTSLSAGRSPGKPSDTPSGPSSDEEWMSLKLGTKDITCDLRGLTVDEALAALESFLDKKSLVNDKFLFIIHGHGMGKVKSAVREFLQDSSYIIRHRPGLREEGGDGVTVVEMF